MMKLMKTSAWSMIFWAAAYMTAIGGAGHAWATGETVAGACIGMTVDHTSAHCLVATTSSTGKDLATQNTCTPPGRQVLLGTVVAEITVSDSVEQPDGTYTDTTEVYRRWHSDSDPLLYSLSPDSMASYSEVGCCPSDGICQLTDCDTTNGVINDGTNTTHCVDINDSDGTIMHSGKEIENGELVDASSDQDAE